MGDIHVNLQQYQALMKQQRKEHKFKAKPAVVDGIHFPSKRQAARYLELKLLEKAGRIENLQIDGPKTTFKLIVNGMLVCTYRADATYTEDGKLVVEDSKGMKTDYYKLKSRLVRACLGIEIRET